MAEANGHHSWYAGHECRQHWRTYLVTCCAALVFAVVATVSIPSEYGGWVTVADESKEVDLRVGLSNMQAWLKTALELNTGYKNIEVYARHITGNSFAEEMSQVPVVGYGMNYGEYLRTHRRRPWWEHFFTSDDDVDILGTIQENIKTEVKAKMYTLRILVTDQDPVVAAMMVDSVRVHLQRFVANEQRKLDLQHLDNTYEQKKIAERRYREAQQRYSEYMDSHQGAVLARETTEEKALEREYNKAYQSYSDASVQCIRAEALVNKPHAPFAVLKNASVHQEPIAPSFMGYFLSFLAIALIGTTWSILLRKQYRMRKGGEASWA